MAKKDFKGNPAMNFMSQETIDKVDRKPRKAAALTGNNKPPAGYKLNPEYIETKSRRVQLLMQPSIYEAIKAEAQAAGISFNEVVNTVLRAHIER